MSLEVSIKLKVMIVFIISIVLLVIIDLALQALYRIKTNEYTWESIEKVEAYRITYLDPVNDERSVIPQKLYKDSQVEIDQYGFRSGDNTVSTKDKNIVFLGDSVPFGLNAGTHDTIPSKLGNFLKEMGKDPSIINAAVPSYSLDQAVYRYIYDIEGKFPVSVVTLQIYDPAGSFYRLGHDWDPSLNWYTTGVNRRIGPIKKYANQKLKYSSLYYLYWRYSGLYFQPVSSTTYNEDDVKRYKDSIVKSLDRLLAHTSEAEQIVLLPITRPKHKVKEITSYERTPIDLLNEVFRNYALFHPKVYFLDTRILFDRYPDEEIFLDACCHLTTMGLNLEAEYIKDFILSLEKHPR